MNWKKWSPINSMTLMGLIVLIIVSGIGIMTVMSLQVKSEPGTVIANVVDGKYYTTLYRASDYKSSLYHDGNPFVYDFVKYEGKSLNLTLTPNVLAVDSVYLMRITDSFYSWDSGKAVHPHSNEASYMRDLRQDVIKIAEYDLPTNVVSLGIIDIPENDDTDSSWWLICFCTDMGYRGNPGNNPDGRVMINIVVD